MSDRPKRYLPLLVLGTVLFCLKPSQVAESSAQSFDVKTLRTICKVNLPNADFHCQSYLLGFWQGTSLTDKTWAQVTGRTLFCPPDGVESQKMVDHLTEALKAAPEDQLEDSALLFLFQTLFRDFKCQ